MSLKITTVLSYRDFFEGEKPNLETILQSLPMKEVLIQFSMYLVEIEKNGEGEFVQDKIWNDIIIGIPLSLRLKLKDVLSRQKLKKNNHFVQVFSRYYILEFIQYVLKNYDDILINCQRPNDDTSILKAYLLLVERTQEKDKEKFEVNRPKKFDEMDESSKFYFQQMTWPIITKQHSVSRKVNLKFEVMKYFLLYEFLKSNYPEHYENFLNSYSAKSIEQIFVVITECIRTIGFKDVEENINFTLPILSNLPVEVKQIIDEMACELKDIKNILKETKPENLCNDFLLIREKPILKINIHDEDSFLIISSEFLKDKLFRAIVFDFYKRSGIDSKFKTLPDFLNEKASFFTERVLFKTLVSYCFKGKYNSVIFDENQMDGMSDCYVRVGKYILLIELKDSLMPAKTIESGDFVALQNDILTKFFENKKGKNKGIKQIIRNIYRINEKPFDFDRFDKKGIKLKNIIVIPIVVFTDQNYSMSGIQDFLRKKFVKSINSKDVNNIGKVEDLIMFDLDLFYEVIVRGLEKNLISYLIEFNNKTRKRMKDFNRSMNFENEIKTYGTFDESIATILDSTSEKLKFSKIIDFITVSEVA
jgi:hypothetical protein